MKILYHHRIASKDGQYVHLSELVNALEKNGHDVRLIGPKLSSDEDNSGNIMIDTLKKMLPGSIYEILEFVYSFLAFFRLSRAVEEYNPDIIYERYNLFSPAGIWVKKKKSIPLFLEVNAPLFDERSKFSRISLKRLAKWSEIYVWKNADKIFTVTNVLAELIAENGIERSCIEVTPNGINIENYAENVLPTPHDEIIPHGKFILGFVGYFREWHGVERLVNFIALNKDKNLHLLIVGDGPSKNNILEYAQTRNVSSQVTITGVVSRELIPSYIKKFDIAVQPNVVTYASPLKLFEYMAASRAIVAPNIANITEILVDRENAILFDKENDESLFTAFTQLYENSALRNNIGNRARETIIERELTWLGNAKRIQNVAKNFIT